MPASQESSKASGKCALHQQGLESISQGRVETAIEFLRQAQQKYPSDSNITHDLAIALAKRGHLDEAIELFEEALTKMRDSPEAHRNFALALQQQGDYDRAVETLRQVVRIVGDEPATLFALGKGLRLAARLDESIEVLRQAIAIDDAQSAWKHELGAALADAGNFAEAVEVYRESLALAPNHPACLNNLGVALQEVGQLSEAEDSFRKCLAVEPDSVDALNNLGVTLAAKGEPEEADRIYLRALQINPTSVAALNNRGNALRAMGRTAEAIACLQRAIDLKPGYAEAHNNLAIAFMQRRRVSDALREYDRAIYFRPDYSEAHLNKALAWLSLGRFEQGWAEYEWRWKSKELGRRKSETSRWDGQSLDGKSILVRHEQGLGDTIQFIRFARLLKQRGAYVVAQVQKPLVPLLTRCAYLDRVVTARDSVNDCDTQCPLLSLPFVLKTRLESIPADTPYVFADSERVKRWEDRLREYPGFRVGIAWQGNKQYRGDRQRSIPLEFFEKIASLPGVRLISLQKGDGCEQLSNVGFEVIQFDDLDEDLPFEDTAALMQVVDIVVTSDTCIPHLAGSLEAEVCLALPYAPDWRWLTDGNDSPWYPSMRVFRQQKPGDWERVFQEIAQHVEIRISDNLGKTKAVDQSVDEAEQFHSMGLREMKQGNIQVAVEFFQKAVETDTNHLDANHNLGVAFASSGKVREAIEQFLIAVELRPDFALAHKNLVLAYLEVGMPRHALAHIRSLDSEGQWSAELCYQTAQAFLQMRRDDEAKEMLERAVALRPDYTAAHCTLATVLLKSGDFERGWGEQEWRWHGRRTTKKLAPRWDGRFLDGSRVFLDCDGTLEEQLLFLRFAQLVSQRGGSAILRCCESLKSLLRDGREVVSTVPSNQAIPADAYHAPLLSLGALCRDDPFCTDSPYLKSNAERFAFWNQHLSGYGGLKVGIALAREGEEYSKAKLIEWATAIHPSETVHWIPLPSDPMNCDRHQIANSQGQFEPLNASMGDCVDLTALLANLDLVITFDGVVAHLAGALGRPGWVVLTNPTKWYWMQPRNESPWYRSLRLFEHRDGERLDDVLARVAADISSRFQMNQTLGDSPSTVNADFYEGRRCLQHGKRERAIKLLRRVVAIDATHVEAHRKLGVALLQEKHFEEAALYLKRCTEISPAHYGTWADLGIAYLNLQQDQDATQAFERALELEPELPFAHNFLGVAYARQGNWATAESCYREAIQLDPSFADAHNNLANTLREQKRFTEAIAHYETAVGKQPDCAEFHNNMGVMFNRIGDGERSIEHHRKATDLRPTFADAYNNLGVAYADQHCLDEAISAFQQAICLDPKRVDAHTNLSLVLLMQGDFERGWHHYEWRLRKSDFEMRHPESYLWDGKSIEGRRLLLWSEQGLGDTFQFIRYGKLLKDKGCDVVVECQPHLVPLLSRCSFVSTVVPIGGDIPAVDAHVPLLSLPARLKTTLENVPNESPYLNPDPALIHQWQERVSEFAGIKVGIAWQGSRSYAGDHFRSIPLKEFAPLAELDKIQLISLQQGEGREQIGEFKRSHKLIDFPNMDEESGSFMDTAALMSSLDLVITSDTSVPHLAGALGVTTWVALCWQSDWRWLRDRQDSPWYPSMRLFRQIRPGDWPELMERIARTLDSDASEVLEKRRSNLPN